MPLEIEAKMKVDGHDGVRARLRELGARHVSDVVETNTFFDAPDGRLKAGDTGLRLRTVKNLHGPRGPRTGRTTYVVTLKGPVQAGPMKSREELETEVTDPAVTTEIFTRLGYAPTLTFEKKRQTWDFQACTVELDEMPLLGTFVEVEGPDAATVESVRQALGLGDLPMIKPGYASMLRKHLDERNVTDREVRFS